VNAIERTSHEGLGRDGHDENTISQSASPTSGCPNTPIWKEKKGNKELM
jgi:hypothetical protein